MVDDDLAAQSRREQILLTAKRLFAQHGFRETSLQDVAVELGVRRQAVYHYFSSKDEILHELIARAGSALEASVEPALQLDAPADTVIAEVVRRHVRGLSADPDVFRIQFAELPKLEGDRADELRADIERYVGRVADVIASGQAAGTIIDGPPTALALMLIGMCNFTLEWHTDDSALDDALVEDLCARIATSGVTRS